MDTSKKIKIPEQTKAELKDKAQALGVHYESDAMSEVMYLANTAASSKMTVLITGETGVGKGQIAKVIHEGSDRADNVLRPVNCGATPSPDGMLQNELFGHEKGAYTDATSQQLGFFEQADGGTIFLDEIGNLDIKSQETLLSIIEGKGFTRIGGSVEITVNVRVIAATNKDLEQAIKEGDFREDLYYRVNQFPIHIPPLRERREDIPALIEHFIETSSAEHGTTVTGTTDEVYQRLLNAYWASNVRGLETAIGAAVLMSKNDRGEILELSHFRHNLPSAPTQKDRQVETGTGHSTDAIYLVMKRQDVTRDALEKADKNLNEEVLYTVDALITKEIRKPTDLDTMEDRKGKGYVSRGRINTFVEKCWESFFSEEIKDPPKTGDFVDMCHAVWKTEREANTDTGNQSTEGNANTDMPPRPNTGNQDAEDNANTDMPPRSTTYSERKEWDTSGRNKITYAILLDKNMMEAAHYNPVTGESELVRFPPNGNTSIATKFHVSQDTGQITLAETEQYNIELNVEADQMDLSIRENPGDEVTIDDLLLVLFRTVVEADETATGVDKTVVCVASENPVIECAALNAGFSEVNFLPFTDAAIREWEHVQGRGEALDVVVLKCNADGSLSWELQVADKDHDYFTPTKNGQFVPATTTDVDVEAKLDQGLTRFAEWNKTNGSRNVVVTGRQAQTDVVLSSLSMLQWTGYNVFSCEAVLGASKPLISRHAQFDAALERVLAAEAVGNFDSAVENLQSAEAIFPSPSGAIRIGIDQLKARLRSAILSEAEEAQTSERASHLYEQAFTLSTTDKERSAVYTCLVDSYCEVGNFVEAEMKIFATWYPWANVIISNISEQLCDNELESSPQQITQAVAEELDNTSEFLKDKYRLHCQSFVKKQAVDFLPGSLHRLNDNINVVLVGPPDSGKTALANNLYGDEVDVPDRTKAILRLPFANGFTLWDTPGLLSDEDSNTTRAWLGLEQQHGEAMSHINFVDAGLQPLAYQHVPVETVAEKFSREEAVILFVLDLTMTVSQLSTVRADLEALREIYGNRLLVIGAFADQFSDWTPLARKKRREIWSERIGSDWVEYSAMTKEELLEIVRRILQASGRDASDLLPHLKAEVFPDSLHTLSRLMAACVWGLKTEYPDKPDEADPYTDLGMRFLILWAVYLDLQGIDIDEASWLKVKDEVEKTINHITQSGLYTREDKMRHRNYLLTPGERLSNWLRTGGYYTVIFYKVNVPALVKIFVLIYGLLHDSFTIESPRIEDGDLEQWLAAEMVEIDESYLFNPNSRLEETFAQQLETIWVRLFRRFHPSALSALPINT